MTTSPTSNLSAELVEGLLDTAKDWAQTHSICMRLKTDKKNSDYVQIAPFTLVPSTVYRRLYDQAYQVQKDMNLLYHLVAFDYEFMKKALENVVANDDFTKRLFEIYTSVQRGGFSMQPVVLTIQRADYMFHTTSTSSVCAQGGSPMSGPIPPDDGSVTLKQVEVNNIAASFAGLDSRVTELHAEILRQLRHKDIKERVPENRALNTVADGLVAAWRYYGNPANSCVLFVVEHENQNIFDQRLIEYEMLRRTESQVVVKFWTLAECFERLSMSTRSKLIATDTKMEIAVVYYRVGYMPHHYKNETEWRARLMMEQSAAIKCPWIGAHLAGTKKVQQVLSDPDVLARFVPDPETRRRIASTFVGLYSLEKTTPGLDQLIEKVCQTPENYVLKPQLEGGGNNFYGDRVREKLTRLSADERESFILMDRIRPVEHENVLIRAKETPTTAKVVSEFGVFGYVLGGAENVLANESGGHLLRTKGVGTDEGGVMAGASVLDSPYLV